MQRGKGTVPAQTLAGRGGVEEPGTVRSPYVSLPRGSCPVVLARGARGGRSCGCGEARWPRDPGSTGLGSRVTRTRLGRDRVTEAEEGQNLETNQSKCWKRASTDRGPAQSEEPPVDRVDRAVQLVPQVPGDARLPVPSCEGGRSAAPQQAPQHQAPAAAATGGFALTEAVGGVVGVLGKGADAPTGTGPKGPCHYI